MTAKLFALREDPDTKEAGNILEREHIPFKLITVDAVLPSLARDLDANDLPVLMVESTKLEGLGAIKAFFQRHK